MKDRPLCLKRFWNCTVWPANTYFETLHRNEIPDVWFFLGTSHFEKAMQNHAKPMSCHWISQCKKHRKWKKFQASLWLEGISSLWASSDRFWFRAFHLQPLNPYILHNLYIYIHMYIGESYMTPGIFPKQFKGKHWQIRIQIRCSVTGAWWTWNCLGFVSRRHQWSIDHPYVVKGRGNLVRDTVMAKVEGNFLGFKF